MKEEVLKAYSSGFIFVAETLRGVAPSDFGRLTDSDSVMRIRGAHFDILNSVKVAPFPIV